MNVIYDGRLEFITPAFLAGADQNRPEIRVPSIRGALRWWFRVLGGTREEESLAFGAVHGTVTSSALVIRTSETAPQFGPPLSFAPTSDFGYLYYFAKASGNTAGIRRTEAQHYFAPGTAFRLQVLTRHPLPQAVVDRIQEAIETFVRIGAIGLRATRGCGALAHSGEALFRQDLLSWTERLSPKVLCKLANEEVYPEWRRCQEALGGWLRQFRKTHHLSGKTDDSALGFSLGKRRESSALRLRPIRVKEGFLPLLVYSDEVCSQESLWDRL